MIIPIFSLQCYILVLELSKKITSLNIKFYTKSHLSLLLILTFIQFLIMEISTEFS